MTSGKAGFARLRTAAALLVAMAASACGAAGLDAVAAQPGRVVRLDGQRGINLVCRGRGQPTVILESGFGAGADAWAKVQPQLARTTRVCAYDRAGYGFSDPGPLPRDGAAIARDLDQALQGAGIRGPFIVVGHSAGGLYGRLFAGRRLSETVGLVLADPTVERRAAAAGGDGLDGIRRRLHRCLASAEAGLAPDPDEPAWQGCIGRNPDAHAIEVARRPETWRGQISELDAILGRTSEQVTRMGGLLKEIPAYVITASDTAASAPTVGFDKPVSVWTLQHQQLAGGFLNGSQQTVLSSHLVMNERPEVIVAATLEMVRAARVGRPPAPLPPTEGLSTPEAAEPSPFGG